MATGEMSFWEHLDELRAAVVRSLVVVGVLAVVAFCLKEPLFRWVLAPRSSDFATWRLLGVEPFSIHLMNTGLTEQFFIHVSVSLYAGLLLGSPWVLYELFRFVSPALYAGERRVAVPVVVVAYVMFLLGVALCYLLVFPLTVRFLGTYQVSPDVENMLTLQSYVDTFISMSLVVGVVFELPVVCWLLGRMGLVSGQLMRRYRRHAIVAILVVAAVITPTTDVLTLLVVSLPIWVLYEVSIFVVGYRK